MRRTLFAFLAAASLAAAASAGQQSPGRGERVSTLSYGSNPAQQLDFHTARGQDAAR